MDKIKVLYVEDDPQWHEIMREVITMLGYQVDIVSSSKEAMFKLKRSTYHIALLDKRLDENNPENDEGLNVATVIAGIGEGTKIIVYTAYGNIEDARQAFKNIKVRDFIGKDRPMPEITKALQDSAEEARREFNRPARVSELLSVNEDEAVKQFLTMFPTKTGSGSNSQDLELFARRLLKEYRPLLNDRKEAKLLKLSQVSVLQVRFWSKMLGSPIAALFGKFKDMKHLVENLETNESLRSSQNFGDKTGELFEINSFPQFGGAIFELKNVEFDKFVSGLEFRV